MLLIDTTVWVDYFNGVATPESEYLDRAISQELILVGDLIQAEVLQGFREDCDFEQARDVLAKFTQAQMLDPELAVRSAMNYRTLRKRGITVRKTIDCLIATYAITFGHELLHSDRDFDPFESYLGLRVVHPRYRIGD